ncbi:short-chain dehydrogenase, partial [Burkholderia pseudomallei]
LQRPDAPSQHAIQGFPASHLLDLEAATEPEWVTLVKPAAVDTMYVMHAKNYMNVEAKLPPPIYEPDLVADAILFAAEPARR